jgi:hypothetical protein
MSTAMLNMLLSYIRMNFGNMQIMSIHKAGENATPGDTHLGRGQEIMKGREK